jgi:hypothetical protein
MLSAIYCFWDFWLSNLKIIENSLFY